MNIRINTVDAVGRATHFMDATIAEAFRSVAEICNLGDSDTFTVTATWRDTCVIEKTSVNPAHDVGYLQFDVTFDHRGVDVTFGDADEGDKA